MSSEPTEIGRAVTEHVGGRRGDAPATIVAALDRLSRARRLHRQTVATHHGCTPLQIDLLLTVASGPPPEPTVGGLAREVGVSQPTATDSISALERKRLVVRAASGSDRRQRLVALTAAGVAVVSEVERADEIVRVAVADTEPAQQEAALRALLGIIARFVDAGIIEVARTCVTCRFHSVTEAGTDHCSLLGTDLAPSELRIDCPDHVPAAGSSGQWPIHGRR